MTVTRPYGYDELMVSAAVLYCLGRQTYIVSHCADWLIELWPRLQSSTQRTLQRDIEREFARDDEARERLDQHLPLGADVDRQDWERVRALWRAA